MAIKPSPYRFFLSACLLVCAALPLHAWAIDTDGDGVDDSVDAFPNDPCAATDTDHDGVADSILASCVLVADSFETGDFSALNWTTTPAKPWVVQSSDYRKGGMFGAKSDVSIGSNLQFTATLSQAGVISFWASDEGAGSLVFSIDGVTISRIKNTGGGFGSLVPKKFAFSVGAGTHTFKWSRDSYNFRPNSYLDDVLITTMAGAGVVVDNCPFVANPDQRETDVINLNEVAGIGDACRIWPLYGQRKGSSIRESASMQ